MMESICEERVRIRTDSGDLGAILAYPAAVMPRHGVLICSPHPNFAGNMENNVIEALSRALAERAVTLRFDYRGVGTSSIELGADESVYDFWNRVEETQEYSAPFSDTQAAADFLAATIPGAPLSVAGYSFGCITGLHQLQRDVRMTSGIGIAPPLARFGFEFLTDSTKPCLLLSGGDDFVFDSGVWTRLQAACPAQIHFESIAGHDHFFHGEENLLCNRASAFLNLEGTGK